ncbi:MAG: molybdopterin molybdotransferase MoeA [Steroidobacteraceae bacterium]|nr:molybdopterin molybdotransferase MoeA [Steroidobacteraceae bacterium]
MLTPAQADAAIAAALVPLGVEVLPLSACAGRVLRQPVNAERDVPPFDRVAMDGIAIAHGPRREFRVAGMQPAGAPALALGSPADCIEVMTGAVLPAGCDTVVPFERLRLADGRAALEPGCEPQPWQNVHRRGSDARAGATLLAPGARLAAPEIAIAASAGLAEIAVSRQPRIAVISTGDELVDPGEPVLAHQLRRSNSYGLGAALALAGCAPATDLHLPDREDVLRDAFARELAGHDLLVLSGGVSAGRHDFVPAALAACGVRRVFHQVSQRPGRPLWFGAHPDGALVFALPGNPVAVLVCLARYVLPALAALAGALPAAQPRATLAQPFEFRPPLSCFLPVSLEYDQGRTLARPRPTGGSGDLVSLAGTDGFVELPPGPATHPAGLAVTYFHW